MFGVGRNLPYSEASKAGEGLSFVTRKADVLNSVAME